MFAEQRRLQGKARAAALARLRAEQRRQARFARAAARLRARQQAAARRAAARARAEEAAEAREAAKRRAHFARLRAQARAEAARERAAEFRRKREEIQSRLRAARSRWLAKLRKQRAARRRRQAERRAARLAKRRAQQRARAIKRKRIKKHYAVMMHKLKKLHRSKISHILKSYKRHCSNPTLHKHLGKWKKMRNAETKAYVFRHGHWYRDASLKFVYVNCKWKINPDWKKKILAKIAKEKAAEAAHRRRGKLIRKLKRETALAQARNRILERVTGSDRKNQIKSLNHMVEKKTKKVFQGYVKDFLKHYMNAGSHGLDGKPTAYINPGSDFIDTDKGLNPEPKHAEHPTGFKDIGPDEPGDEKRRLGHPADDVGPPTSGDAGMDNALSRA
eukprot:TRINITY_DN623_c0_g2_i6.p1 TRINITY_DN623_c0_g2~~TRINITY_DN623_c0_g2_i6.p1  ORF type:complete len:390 (+),score=115.47 TRINITY_DN623_c0_g2_i6:1368-2537(+)